MLTGMQGPDQEPIAYELPVLPESDEEKEAFLEEERLLRPLHLIYRFYGCGGFWLCDPSQTTVFLQTFSSKTLCDMLPFIRKVVRAKLQMDGADTKNAYSYTYGEMFRALALQGRDNDFIALWEEATARLYLIWMKLTCS